MELYPFAASLYIPILILSQYIITETVKYQQENSNSLLRFVRLTGWVLLLIAPLSLYYGVDWNALDVPNSVSRCITILLCAVIMWIFRLLPDFVPSVFLLVGLLVLEVAPPTIVFSGYGSQVFFVALCVLSLSSMLTSSRLSQRILSYIVYKWQAKNKTMFSTIVFIFGLLMTPFIPSTNGRAALIAPFLDDALTQIPQNSKEHQRLIVALLGGISLLSPVFLSAKSINLLLWGMLSIHDQHHFNYLFWTIAALLPGLILVTLFLIVQALVFFNNDKISIREEAIKHLFCAENKLSRKEKVGIVTMCSLVLLVITHPYHRIEIHLLAITLFFSLLLFNVIHQRRLSNSIDWGFLIFIGAMIGFSNVLQFLRLDELVTANLSWLTQYIGSNDYMFIFLLSALVFLFRLFMPINATVILLGGALIPVSAIYGGYAWVVGFVILMMAESYIFPYQASYYMQCTCTLGVRHAKALHAHRVYALNGSVFFLKLAAIYLSLPYWTFLGVL